MTWKTILKKLRFSTKLFRYLAYTDKYSPTADYNRSSYDRITLEEFAEKVHGRERMLGDRIRAGTPRVIEKEIFDEINEQDPDDPHNPFEVPFSYDEYMEKYGNAILEQKRRDDDLDRRLKEMAERKRRKKLEEIRAGRGPEYYQQMGPQPLRTQNNEEE